MSLPEGGREVGRARPPGSVCSLVRAERGSGVRRPALETSLKWGKGKAYILNSHVLGLAEEAAGILAVPPAAGGPLPRPRQAGVTSLCLPWALSCGRSLAEHQPPARPIPALCFLPPAAGPGLPEAGLLLGLRRLRPAGPRRAEGRDGPPTGEAVRLPGAWGVPVLCWLHLLLRRQ